MIISLPPPHTLQTLEPQPTVCLLSVVVSSPTEGVFSAKRLNAVAAQKNGEDLLLHMVREPFFIQNQARRPPA